MRRSVACCFLVVCASLVACKKPAKVEVVSFRERSPTYGQATITFEVKTAPGARIEYAGGSTYASATGEARLEFPADKVVAKPGGKGQIYVNVQPPRESKQKNFAGPCLFDWPAAVKVEGETISCGSRVCRGKLDKYSPRLDLEVEPGTVVEVDGQRLPSSGPKITTTLDLGKRALSAPTSVLGKDRSNTRSTSRSPSRSPTRRSSRASSPRPAAPSAS